MELHERLEEWRALVEQALERYLPTEEDEPTVLHRAMRYSVFAGGKRVRPALLLEACAVAGGNPMQALPAACAVELIHTYSLIHDDLPCMDDADTRRSKPTCHKAFGEAVAVLAGDALLTLAFEVLAELPANGVDPTIALQVTQTIAQAVGSLGMVGGQTLDILHTAEQNDALTLEQLYAMHTMKTGRLIQASLEAGGLIADAPLAQQRALREFGRHIGLAFQIADDLLDVEGTEQSLGKTTGDAAKGKLTFPAVLGITASRALAQQTSAKAVEQLAAFGAEADVLRQLAWFVVDRKA